LAVVAASALFYGCPVGVGEISCVKDDNCSTGMYCGANGICGVGIPPGRDTGVTDVGEGRSDGSNVTDVGEPRRDGSEGDVPSAPDASDGGDAESDTSFDAAQDGSYPSDGSLDATDGGDTVVPDGGQDTGVELSVPQSRLYQGTAGVCENDELIVRSVSGWSARQMMSNDELVVRSTVFVK